VLVESLYSEAQHINHVVTNLLDITRLETDSVRLNLQWHPLEELLGAALDRLRPQLNEHPVDVEIPSDLPMIRVDDVLFEKLLVNLLENAAKYTPARTRILISAQHLGAEVRIIIADQGPGFPPASEQKLFEKFYRASTEGSVPGAGLGLAICRSIMQAHGGAIRAANNIDGGAVFTIALPFQEPPADEPEVVAS
jgi:two-component system sensor histidine kinase KdpD